MAIIDDNIHKLKKGSFDNRTLISNNNIRITYFNLHGSYNYFSAIYMRTTNLATRITYILLYTKESK